MGLPSSEKKGHSILWIKATIMKKVLSFNIRNGLSNFYFQESTINGLPDPNRDS